MKTKVIRPGKPFDYVEREHKDSASKYMQSLLVSVKMTDADGVATLTPNHSFTEALAAARKCCDVRLLASDSIDEVLYIFYLAGFTAYTDNGVKKYRLVFANPNGGEKLAWTEDGLSILDEDSGQPLPPEYDGTDTGTESGGTTPSL